MKKLLTTTLIATSMTTLAVWSAGNTPQAPAQVPTDETRMQSAAMLSSNPMGMENMEAMQKRVIGIIRDELKKENVTLSDKAARAIQGRLQGMMRDMEKEMKGTSGGKRGRGMGGMPGRRGMPGGMNGATRSNMPGRGMQGEPGTGNIPMH